MPVVIGLLKSLARIALGVIVLVPIALYLLQDRLIFFPQPIEPQVRAAIARSRPAPEEVHITARDGTRLHGWFLKNSTAAKAPALIYFGGNAEEVSGLLLDAESVPGIALLLINYRGYGLSEGEPGEAALFDDARIVFDRLARREDVDPSRIAVMGRSLGSGVATFLASQRPLAAVVLVTPYDSLAAVAQRKYPFLPVSWLLRHRFDSIARAPHIKVPMLALAAGDDTLIPPEHARRLVEAWGGDAELVVLDGVGHDDVNFHARYWPEIAAFLRRQHMP